MFMLIWQDSALLGFLVTDLVFVMVDKTMPVLFSSLVRQLVQKRQKTLPWGEVDNMVNVNLSKSIL